jgi:hypothetical protein
MNKYRILPVMLLLLAGCAAIKPGGADLAAPIVPIDGAILEVKRDLTFLPSLSGLFFPAGIYPPVAKDGHGVFYQSPRGIKFLNLGGSYFLVGGIYRYRADDGLYRLKSWQGKPKLGFWSRDLHDMIGTNFTEALVFHESQ